MQSFAKSAAKFGRKLTGVDSKQKEPCLNYGLEFFLDAFIDLDSERSHGMGWMRIPWHCIWQYGIAYELDTEQMDDLIYFITRMDAAHIERLEEKREQTKNRK
jgi:hypothetical protein